MTDDPLTDAFEAHRPRLHSVAQRMLGNPTEADDAVQEAWLRLHRSDAGTIDNLGGWLTTVVARVSLDMLRARAGRGPLDGTTAERPDHRAVDPETEAQTADGVGAALMVVLDTLTPAERLAFVLHDMFAVPFDEIAGITGRSPAASKMLASRARQKVRGARPLDDDVVEADPARQRAVVDAFLAASRAGDFAALLAVLHPGVAMHTDEAGVRMGSPALTTGAAAVAGTFSGRAQGAQAALIDGAVGLVWIVGGTTKVVWDFSVIDGVVSHIDMVADPATIASMTIEL